jgi:hypothetical protein
LLINNNVNITAATHVYQANFGVEDLILSLPLGNSSISVARGLPLRGRPLRNLSVTARSIR